jgi:YD repeat-containing protein
MGESVKRLAMLTLAVAMIFWGCATAPEEPAQQAESETVTQEAAEDTGTEVAEEAPVTVPEDEPQAAPGYRLDRVVSYLSNGVLDTVKTLVYQDGLLVEELETYADGSPAGKTVYSYENGVLANSIEADRNGDVVSAFSYIYDDSGKLIEETLLDTTGNPIFTYRLSYNAIGRRTLLEILASNGVVLSYAEYMYSEGRNHRIETFSLLGTLQEYLERSFDDEGRTVREVVSTAGGEELEKVTYEYLDEMLTGRETHVRTRKVGSTKYEYDDAGNLTVRIRYDRTGKLIETNEYYYVEVAK